MNFLTVFVIFRRKKFLWRIIKSFCLNTNKHIVYLVILYLRKIHKNIQFGFFYHRSSAHNTSAQSSTFSRYDPARPLFRRVLLTSKNEVVHIANINQKPFVVSAEISALIPRWKGDILSKMLKLVRESKPSIVYHRDKAFALFEQCLM